MPRMLRLIVPTAFLAAALAIALPGPVTASSTTETSPAVASARALGDAIAEVAENARPAVVFLQVEARAPTAGPTRMLPFGLPGPAPDVPRGGQGSGFVISSDGLVLTNAHVVRDAEHIAVRFHDGRELEGHVVGADLGSDVAVVRVDGENLPHLDLADSDAIRVGEWVVAIGNPFGLTQTVTAGIVSAKGRNHVGINDLEDFIQTDAAINPGNSGGPLLDLDGRVVGINSAIFSRTGGNMGIGFAVPSNLVKSIATQLEESGVVARGFLGVGIQDLTPDLATALGSRTLRGAVVTEVQPDGAAADSGLEVGDVIIAVDDQEILNGGALRNAVSLRRPGTDVRLSVLREGAPREFKVRLASREKAPAAEPTTPARTRGLGLSVQPLDEALRERLPFDVEEGLVVTRVLPGSAAARAGLAPGAVILSVDRHPASSVAALEEALASAQGGGVLLRVREPRGTRWVVLRLP